MKTLSHGDIDGGYGASFAPPSGPGFIPFPSETADGLPFHRQITQEVHLASKDTSPLDWIVGAYYFNENITIDSFDYNTLAGSVLDGYARQKQLDISAALFGSIGYQVNDQLQDQGRPALLARREELDRDAHALADRRRPDRPAVREPEHVASDRRPFGRLYGHADTDFYARVATGYRAPSIQGRLLFGDAPSIAKTETVTSGEIGVKSRLFDNRATVSFDVFDYEMKNQQLTAVGGNANFATLVNAKKTEGQGFELDAQAYLTDHLMVTAGTSYNLTKIKDPNLRSTPCGARLHRARSDRRLRRHDARADRRQPAAAGAEVDRQYHRALQHPVPRWRVVRLYRLVVSQQGRFLPLPIDRVHRQAMGDRRSARRLRLGRRQARSRRCSAATSPTRRAIIGGIDFDNLTGYVNEPRIWGVQFRAEL